MSLWAWNRLSQSLSLEAVIAALNERLPRLAGSDGQLETVFQGTAKLLTTDATVTTIYTQAIPVSTSLLSVGYVVARRTGGSSGTAEDGAAYRVEYLAKNASGTATVIGSVIAVIGESQAGWDLTVSASSGNVLVRVTGAANNNISWRYSRRTFQVAS